MGAEYDIWTWQMNPAHVFPGDVMEFSLPLYDKNHRAENQLLRFEPPLELIIQSIEVTQDAAGAWVAAVHSRIP